MTKSADPDLALHCLPRQGISGSAGPGLRQNASIGTVFITILLAVQV